MGQKAKNAGKKQSKTCNKLANAKSVKATGCRLKMVEIITPNIIEKQNEADDILNKIKMHHHSKRYAGVRPLNLRITSNYPIEDI